jgi:hypothetical protein
MNFVIMNLPITAFLPATSMAKLADARADARREISTRKDNCAAGATGIRNLACGHSRTP